MGQSARPKQQQRQPQPVDVQVGSQLRHRRKQLGLSMKKLADATGITYQQVQKYETGANRVPASRLAHMAQILGVEPGSFYEEFSHIGFADAEQDPFQGPQDRRVRLLKAFESIESPEARDMLIQLAEQMAEKGSRQNVTPLIKK